MSLTLRQNSKSISEYLILTDVIKSLGNNILLVLYNNNCIVLKLLQLVFQEPSTFGSNPNPGPAEYFLNGIVCDTLCVESVLTFLYMCHGTSLLCASCYLTSQSQVSNAIHHVTPQCHTLIALFCCISMVFA